MSSSPFRRRVACFAAMPFHLRTLAPIGGAFEDAIVTADEAELLAWEPDVIVTNDWLSMVRFRNWCDARNAYLVGLMHGSVFRYSTPDNRYASADYVCASDWDEAQFRRHGVLPRRGFLRTGNCWTDEVFRVPRREIDRTAPTFLFAPTWNPELCAAAFFEGKLLSLVREAFPQARLIIKPHPGILQYDTPHLRCHQEQFKRWIDEWREWDRTDPGVTFVADPGASIGDYYAEADILISDGSSLTFEFMTLERPIMLYTTDGQIDWWARNPEAPDVAWRGVGSEFRTVAEFRDQLARVFEIHEDACLAEQRARTAELYGPFQDGECWRRVVEAIEGLPYTDVVLWPAGGDVAAVGRAVARLGRNARVTTAGSIEELGARVRESGACDVLTVPVTRSLRTLSGILLRTLTLERADRGAGALWRLDGPALDVTLPEPLGRSACLWQREALLSRLEGRYQADTIDVQMPWNGVMGHRFNESFRTFMDVGAWMGREGEIELIPGIVDEAAPFPLAVGLSVWASGIAYYSKRPFALDVRASGVRGVTAVFDRDAQNENIILDLPVVTAPTVTLELRSEAGFVPVELGLMGIGHEISVCVQAVQMVRPEPCPGEAVDLPNRRAFNILVGPHPDPGFVLRSVEAYLHAFNKSADACLHIFSGGDPAALEEAIVGYLDSHGMAPDDIPDISVIDREPSQAALELFIPVCQYAVGGQPLAEIASKAGIQFAEEADPDRLARLYHAG